MAEGRINQPTNYNKISEAYSAVQMYYLELQAKFM